MTSASSTAHTLVELDDATRVLVRVATVIAAGTESEMRAELSAAGSRAPEAWIEEVILQSYLFAGFPRALNAMREWRRLVPVNRSASDAGEAQDLARWRADGEVTCRAVYGEMYERLRTNIRALHPALDEWMIVDGYGKVLSRDVLDLSRRELCIVAACAASGQDRQLHSHLHGALNVGIAPGVVEAALDAIADLISENCLQSARMLWARVRGK